MNKRLQQVLLLSTVLASGLLTSCSVLHQTNPELARLPSSYLPASQVVLTAKNDATFTLETPPEMRTLTPQERIGRIEVLKDNIQYFDVARTAKIKQSIDLLFSIDQQRIRELADNIPDGIKIRNAQKYKGMSGNAQFFYDVKENALYFFSGRIDEQHPIELAARMAHEINHGKQSREGISNPYPAYVDTTKSVSIKLAVEGDSKALHHNVFYTLSEQEKTRTGTVVKWSDANEQRAQTVYNALSKSALNKVKNESPKLSSTQQKDVTSVIAQGKYFAYLLRGNDQGWMNAYIKEGIASITSVMNQGVPMATHPNEKLVNYIYQSYAKKHRISVSEFKKSEKHFLNYNNKMFAKTRGNVEFNYSYDDASKYYLNNKDDLGTPSFEPAQGLLKRFQKASDTGNLNPSVLKAQGLKNVSNSGYDR